MATTAKHDRRLREERLGFRVDEPTKALIERAARLERRKLTDFCMSRPDGRCLAGRSPSMKRWCCPTGIGQSFSMRWVNPPAPSERLQRAFSSISAGRAVNGETTIRGSSYRPARGGARPRQLYLWGWKAWIAISRPRPARTCVPEGECRIYLERDRQADPCSGLLHPLRHEGCPKATCRRRPASRSRAIRW